MLKSKRELIWLIENAGPDGPATDQLVQMGEEIIPFLLREFKRRGDFGKNIVRKMNILHVLGKFKDERAVEFLVKILKNPESDYYIVAGLMALLEFYDHPKAKEIFAHYLYADNSRVRTLSAMGLYKLGDPRGIENLIYELDKIHPVLKKEISIHERGSAAFFLGRLGDKRAIDPLFCNFAELREYVAKTLIKIARVDGKNIIINRAVQMLGSTTSEAFWAAYILCMLGDERGLPIMIEVLKDEKPGRRSGKGYTALKSLAGLNTDKALKILARYLEESDVESCIEGSFLYRAFESDVLLKVINVDMEKLKKEMIENDQLVLSHITRKIDDNILSMETKKKEERFKQMAREVLNNFRLKYKEKEADTI